MKTIFSSLVFRYLGLRFHFCSYYNDFTLEKLSVDLISIAKKNWCFIFIYFCKLEFFCFNLCTICLWNVSNIFSFTLLYCTFCYISYHYMHACTL